MGISDYFAEIMKQPYNSNLGLDYTKLAILLFLKKNRFSFTEIPLMDLIHYIYRFYADNPSYSATTNYVTIRNISNYRPVDIIDYVKEMLQEWISNGNDVLQFSSNTISINPKLVLTDSEISNLTSMCDIVIKKYYGRTIEYDDTLGGIFSNINLSNLPPEDYLERVNKTKFRQRALENLNYCCCCDESHVNKIFAVHINLTNNIEDPDNSLIFCREHALLYLKKYFRFNTMGKIELLKHSPLLDSRMRISQEVLPYKKKYL